MTESPNPKRMKRSLSHNNHHHHHHHKPPFHFDYSKHLSAQDAALVTYFLSSRSGGHLCVSSDAEGANAYGSLAALLGLLKRHTMLEIIDFKNSEFLELVRIVRGFSCEGKASWLDSLEEAVRSNSHVDVSSVKALEKEESALDSRIVSQREWLNERGRRLRTSLSYMFHIKVLEDELENVRDKMKRALEARAALNYKHTF